MCVCACYLEGGLELLLVDLPVPVCVILDKEVQNIRPGEKEEKDELKQWPVSWPGWMIQSSTNFHLLYHHPNPIMTRM